MVKKKVYKLSDDAIAQVVKLLQLGILSGTDIADNFRTLELVIEGDRLVPSPDYIETLETSIQRMQDQLQDQLQVQAQAQPAGFKGFN